MKKPDRQIAGLMDQERKKPKYFVIIDGTKVEPLIDCHDFDEALAQRATLCWPISRTRITTFDTLRELRKNWNALYLGGL